MKTVKVKMLSDEVNRAGDPLEKGSIQEFTEDSADYWIRRGKGELVKDEPKGKTPAKVEKTPEQLAADDKTAADAEAKRVADEKAAAEQKAREDAAKGQQQGAGTQQK